MKNAVLLRCKCIFSSKGSSSAPIFAASCPKEEKNRIKKKGKTIMFLEWITTNKYRTFSDQKPCLYIGIPLQNLISKITKPPNNWGF